MVKNLRKPTVQKNSTPHYKMPRRVKQRIKGLIAAAAISLGAIPIAAHAPTSALENPTPQEPTPVETMCTIGIPNNDAHITVDGKKHKIDQNSFIIVSEDTTIAYDELGNMHNGHVDEEDFKEVLSMTEEELSNYAIYQVVSESGAFIRSTNTIEENNIISTVPYSDYVLGYTAETQEHDGEFLSTLSITDNGVYKGYISESDLTLEIGKSDTLIPEKKPESEEIQNPMQQIKTNAAGSVTGIDISGMTPKQLRALLQNGIPNQVNTAGFGTIDTSQYAGDVNFVYMKIGASPYGKNSEFRVLPSSDYIEKVKICEELGVPYGFYYYSTAITVEEANIELQYLKDCIMELHQALPLDFNKLEIVVDVELAGANDRQYRGNLKEKTEAKAALINGIQKAHLSENVLIYGPIRVMQPNLDQIIDLSYLHSLLDNPDDVSLWLCSPSNSKGELSSTLNDTIAYAESQGFSTVAFQVVLDAAAAGSRIDINIMNVEHYQELMGDEKTPKKIIEEDNER